MKAAWIYFVASGDAIKIGFASSVGRRLRTLQAANPVPLRLLATARGTLRTEQDLHARLWAHRIHAEWYRIDEVVARVVRIARERGSERPLTIADFGFLPDDIRPDARARLLARCRAVIRASGLSNTQVAERSGFRPGTISRIRSAATPSPSPETAVRVAVALGAPENWIKTGADNDAPPPLPR